MPGRLRSSFRFGNLAEHLGLLLLKGIAAVAEVARQEDVGVDAVATLLRPDADGNRYAEESFLVQLKSESIFEIDYSGHALTWLLNQSHPMFIGRVSLADSRLSLYPTLNINAAVFALHRGDVKAHFGPSGRPPFSRGASWAAWGGKPGDPDAVEVWLGEPLVSWTLTDISNSDWADMAYKTLKRFLALAYQELYLLSIGQCSFVEWRTNIPDSIQATSEMMKGHPDEIVSLAQKCKPALRSLMMHAALKADDKQRCLMEALMPLTKALRQYGVDIDEGEVFARIFRANFSPR